MGHPEEFARELKEIYPKIIIAKDGRMKELDFKDE
jgi:hypothetical protein